MRCCATALLLLLLLLLLRGMGGAADTADACTTRTPRCHLPWPLVPLVISWLMEDGAIGTSFSAGPVSFARQNLLDP